MFVNRINILTQKCHLTCPNHSSFYRFISSKENCKLLVIGGGSGGCSIAAKFCKKLEKNDVIVVEPSDTHYYQPMFTLVGGGMKKLSDTKKSMQEVLPKKAVWIRDTISEINPLKNIAITSSKQEISYDYLVIAAGLTLNYNKIPGLVESLLMPVSESGVCSNYSPNYVDRTYEALRNFNKGNAIFTFPNTPVKCPGAPQKICYIAEHFLRMNGKREEASVIYNTSLGVLFGVKKYADALWKVCEKRDIKVNLRTSLVEVKPVEKVALFQNLDKPEEPPTPVNVSMQESEKEKLEKRYSLLHVTPPMGPPAMLQSAPNLCDSVGFLDVDKATLQHKTFPNIFGIGDCTNAPTSKTAAAVAAQCGIVERNLSAVMSGNDPKEEYNGYTSCPLVTGYSSCILAEFDYGLQPLETFPLDQSKESTLMFHLKKSFMPSLYWNAMLRGYWNGPKTVRKIFKFGSS